MAHQLHQTRDDASFHNHVDTVVVTVGQIGDGPARVRQNISVCEVEQLDQRGKHLQEEIRQSILACKGAHTEGLPAGLPTAADKGSYFDTNWTRSMLGYGGIQPVVQKY